MHRSTLYTRPSDFPGKQCGIWGLKRNSQLAHPLKYLAKNNSTIELKEKVLGLKKTTTKTSLKPVKTGYFGCETEV